MPSKSQHLDKTVGTLQLFTLGFGTIIGVGWIIVLGEWLGQAGPLGAALAFAVGGLAMILVGLCYAELAALLPVSGGEIAYAYEAFGLKTSFAIGWFLSLSYISTTIFEAVSIGWLVAVLVPGIQGPTVYTSWGEPVRAGTLLLGLGGMLLITILNYRGVKNAARFQDTVTYSLLGLSAVFIVAGFLGGEVGNLQPLFKNSGSGTVWGGILAVFATAPFWFAGFDVIPTVMEERSSASSLSSMGMVLVASIGMAGLFYCLVIVSASMTMPWENLQALELPAAKAFGSISAPLGTLVLIAGLMGIVSTWNAIFLAASRLIFALGRARVILPAFGNIHRNFHSPTVAVVFVGVVGSIGTLLGRRAILVIVTVSGTCMAFAFFITCLSMIRLRRIRPRQQRPYRTPGGTLTAALAALVCLFMVFVSLNQSYKNAQGIFPLEWAIFLIWAFLGFLFWTLSGAMRRQVSEAERRKLMLGGSASLE